MKEFWDKRYQENETVYGSKSNLYFKEKIDQIPVGFGLLPGEGEGRNAIYAAVKGWKIDAFDYSEVAISKAKLNAMQLLLDINFQCCDMNDFLFNKKYDLVAMMYFHLPSIHRKKINMDIIKNLKEGGHLVLEAFSKEQIHYSSGGPKDLDMLLDLEEMKNDFKGLQFLDLCQIETTLDEGAFHKGKASVIRIHAIKI